MEGWMEDRLSKFLHTLPDVFLYCNRWPATLKERMQGKGTVDLNMPLGNWFLPQFLGSGPDRGRSPVEWGEIPYVLSIHLSIHGPVKGL